MRPREVCGISKYDIDLTTRRLTLNHGVDMKGHLTDLKNLMCNLQITAEQAGAALGISKEELAQLIQKL